MSLPSPALWRAARNSAITISAVALAAGLSAGALGAVSAQAASRSVAHPAGAIPTDAGFAVNPYSPAYGHPYRHGAVPTIPQLFKINNWVASHQSAQAARAFLPLTYGGGVHGIGVTTGPERVYLVFFGRQWGAQGNDGHGNLTLAGDPSGVAPYLQRMLKGLGTHGDSWSGVMTQYCDGAPVNARSCSADTLHVGYPENGVLRGVWVDESASAPSRATGHALAAEAVKAAKHFKNTSANSNRDAQYVIVSPHNTHPDGFPDTGFCAWHDWNGDRTLSGGAAKSLYGPIAFTNLPYLVDAGFRCGVNFLQHGNPLDGVSMVEGHEYGETITDQIPPGGWLDSSGEENGDKCAWNTGPGAPAAELALSTGTFAMQSMWGNDGAPGGGTCEFSHRIVRNLGLFNGGFETGFMGWVTTGATALVRHGVHAGRFAARAGRPTPSHNASIAQTFNARSSHLSLWFNMTCPDTVRQAWATITLTDNTTHHQAVLLARRCTKHPGWHKISHTVIAHHSYTLMLVNHDDHDTRHHDGAFTLLDGVTN
jgi:hypothetical protein